MGPLTVLLRRVLNMAAPEGWADVRVAGGDLAGARLVLDLLQEKTLWLGTYEPQVQAAIRRLARPGMVCYDLGANLGYLSLLLARATAPNGLVFAFEPLPSNYERLRSHIEMNGLADRVRAYPLAVSDTPGRAKFQVHASGGMGKIEGAAGRSANYRDIVEVETLDLDQFVYGQGHPPPDLIKVDVEGAEGLVLAGMRRILGSARPSLLIEVHGPEAAQVTWDLLIAARYRLHRMQPGYPLVESWEALPWKVYLVALPEGVGQEPW
jgi:FkbM family methyltransferase